VLILDATLDLTMTVPVLKRLGSLACEHRLAEAFSSIRKASLASERVVCEARVDL
jgi:hypothetical protein